MLEIKFDMVYNVSVDNISLQYLIETRRKLHAMAELSGREQKTSDFIYSELVAFGYKPKRIGTGVYCDSGKGNRIALRADIDALPITENVSATGCDFAAKGNVMHACGHDGHTANLLNVARIVAGSKQAVRFIFQFGEEGGAGSLDMIDGGVIDGVDEIYALHLCPELESGKIGYCYGGMFAGCVEFDCETYGRSSHCACPEDGNNAIASAIYLYDAIRAAAERNELLFNLGKITGGAARNIVPDKCVSEYTLRFYDSAKSEDVMMSAARAAISADDLFGTKTDILTREVYPPLINDALAVDKVRLVADGSAVEVKPRYTAEDFSNYLSKVSGCMVWLGIGMNGCHTSPLHSDTFSFDERSLLTGTDLFLKLIDAHETTR